MAETFTLEGTQYMRPNGRPVPFSCELPKHLESKAKAVRDAGLRPAAEVLMTNKVSLSLENREMGDYDGEIVANGPSVLDAWARILERFDPEQAAKWQETELANRE